MITVQPKATIADACSETVARLARCSSELTGLSVAHRHTSLASVGVGGVTPSNVIAHVDAIRLLDEHVHYTWRATAHPAAAGT